MKGSSCAARIWELSLLLSLLGPCASCTLETTGSGDLSLSADDDSESADDTPERSDASDASDGVADDDVDGGAGAGDMDDEGQGDAGTPLGNGTCRPGSYEGSYVCKQPLVTGVPWAAGLSGNQITGSLAFRLESTNNAKKLLLSGGKLHSEDNAFFKLDAVIKATLECGRPLKGKLIDATYTILLGNPVPFESPFEGRYDEQTGSFTDGSWVVQSNAGTQCNGTWTARRTGD